MAEDTGDGLKLGDALYRHIAVPENKYMPSEVKKKIAPYLGEGTPEYEFICPSLRSMTRRLKNDKLFFVFNEGESAVTEALDISEGRKVYRIDPKSGVLYREDSPICTLHCGDIAVYLITSEEYETVPDKVEGVTEITGFVPVAHRRFVIEYDGVKNEYGDGKVKIDEGFSGDVTYKAGYELCDEPKAGDVYRIRLEGFSSTALVKLGEREISLGMTPMTAVICGAELEKCGEIEITVSNTAVNEIHAKADVITAHPKAEFGAYVQRLAYTECRRPELRFGRVFIEKLTS